MSSAGFYAGLPLLTEFGAVADPASYAPLPDAAMRKRMAAYYDAL